MKRIIVGSYEDAQRFAPDADEKYAMLSFVDVEAEVPAMRRHPGLVERLVIHADDCSPSDPQLEIDGRRLCPLTPEQAKMVARFVRAVAPKIDTLYIHCHAGQSRSPGAALAIAQALQIAEVTMISETVFPNRHVHKLVGAALVELRTP